MRGVDRRQTLTKSGLNLQYTQYSKERCVLDVKTTKNSINNVITLKNLLYYSIEIQCYVSQVVHRTYIQR